MEVIGALIGLLSFGMFGIIWLLMFAFIIGMMALWVWMIVDVVRRQFEDDNTRLMWVLIVVLAGWVGAIIYYFVGRKQGTMPQAPAAPPGPVASSPACAPRNNR
ncbi:MAG: PLDc_N domain-containing protein [Armatimonadetes bacterium]|nr:PLDc_N domain-containing protein [Armatimonadota bacterium]